MEATAADCAVGRACRRRCTSSPGVTAATARPVRQDSISGLWWCARHLQRRLAVRPFRWANDTNECAHLA
jgi:hypothetical protein